MNRRDALKTSLLGIAASSRLWRSAAWVGPSILLLSGCKLTIPDPKLAATISALLEIVIATVKGYVGWAKALPEAAAATPAVKEQMNVRAAAIPPNPQRADAFRDAFNKRLKADGLGNHAI